MIRTLYAQIPIVYYQYSLSISSKKKKKISFNPIYIYIYIYIFKKGFLNVTNCDNWFIHSQTLICNLWDLQNRHGSCASTLKLFLKSFGPSHKALLKL